MDNSVQPIYEDIDLRPYIENLLGQWRIVVALPIITALITLTASSFLPVSYETTALVAVTNPRFQLSNNTDFDPATPFRAYPELATSDDLIQELYVAVADDLPSDFSDRQQLKNSLAATNGADPSLIRLTVTMNDANTAAIVTNAWADLFVKRANFVFGNQGEDAFLFFESQLGTAEIKLQDAELALVQFQTENNQVTLENGLTVLSETQTAHQRDLRQIRSVLEEVRFLQEQLVLSQADLTTADALAGLILQSKALSIDANTASSEGGNALQFQLTADTLTTTPEGQSALLDRLEQLLVSKQEFILNELLQIEADIIETQTTLQALKGTRSRLDGERTVAAETYESLARKVEESRISSQETAAQVQLASQAAVPLDPAGLSPLIKSILAAVVALMAAVGVSFLSQWWTQGRNP